MSNLSKSLRFLGVAGLIGVAGCDVSGHFETRSSASADSVSSSPRDSLVLTGRVEGVDYVDVSNPDSVSTGAEIRISLYSGGLVNIGGREYHPKISGIYDVNLNSGTAVPHLERGAEVILKITPGSYSISRDTLSLVRGDIESRLIRYYPAESVRRWDAERRRRE